MDKNELLETVSALAEQIGISQLDELEVETETFRIRLSKRPPMPPMPFQGQPPAAAPQPVKTEDKPVSGRMIKSPIIGTFYSAASPGKPAFVSVGSKISKGSVVCIVESMKLMNEINSEFDGTVAEIYVSDGQAVEYDQPLFRIE